MTITWGTVTFIIFLKIEKKRNSSLFTEKCTHHMCTAWWVFTSKHTCAVITHMKEISPASRGPLPALPLLHLGSSLGAMDYAVD